MTTRPLSLGAHQVWPPMVLAPMAGITNIAFRRLCREYGAGLYVCEMVTSRALVERNPKTLRMVVFDPDESPRSLQLYGVDPDVTAVAVRMVAEEGLADHVDLNFGCPVPKVTRKGGGAALPWRRRLFAQIVRAAVDAAGDLPVTVKMRMGIDEDHLTYVAAGLAAQDAGATWVALHGRTAAQRYSGTADWDAIAALKDALDIPVLGNGDVWEAADAQRMLDHTGADGVVVGRGCLGRPWLFADLAAAFADRASSRAADLAAAFADRASSRAAGVVDGPAAGVPDSARFDDRAAGLQGRPAQRLPRLGEVAATMRRHAELLTEWLGSEREGCTDFRKHVAWYLKGFPVGSDLRRALTTVSGLGELDDLLGKLEYDTPFPAEILGQPRGRTNSPGKVALPHGWLENRDDDGVPAGAELDDSGG